MAAPMSQSLVQQDDVARIRLRKTRLGVVAAVVPAAT
jgi:hypothetical protein